jgi:hypothetical protein
VTDTKIYALSVFSLVLCGTFTICYVYTLDHYQRADCLDHGGTWWGNKTKGCIKVPIKGLPK